MLTLFDHQNRTATVENDFSDHEFEHFFGGDPQDYGLQFPNLAHPCQVVYWLDTTDPRVPYRSRHSRFLPLIHGFNYSPNGFEFLYRIVGENVIETEANVASDHNPHFPYDDYPKFFSKKRIGFGPPTEINSVESSLDYKGVFGLEHLSESEMQQAIKVAKETWHPEIFERDSTTEDWTDSDLINCYGREPFYQTTPSGSCENPNCTAKVKFQIDGKDYRESTLQIIALHESLIEDELLWGSAFVQLIYQVCTVCDTITVSNQC